MGRSHLRYEPMEGLLMDIERHLNNRPLTYVESDGEKQVLNPNLIMWEQVLASWKISRSKVTKLVNSTHVCYRNDNTYGSGGRKNIYIV